MIAPRIVSHVQPTPHDYSDRTSPDLITDVPKRFEIYDYETGQWEPLERVEFDGVYGTIREAGRVTLGNVVFWAALMAGGLLFAALTMLGGQAQ